jgi:hypothetical protein
MERFEVYSGNIAVLPQEEFVELAGIIEVIDVTGQEIVWNLHDDIEGEEEFPAKDIEADGGENSSEIDNQSFSIATRREIGYLNTGFLVLLTLIIYPVLVVGNSIWNIVVDVPFFREIFKLLSAILRS